MTFFIRWCTALHEFHFLGGKEMAAEILMIPFPHPGHLFPAIELCNQLAIGNYQITLFYPSSSSPSSLSLNPQIQISEYPFSDSVHFHPQLLENALINQIATHFSNSSPKCVIVDEMVSWIINLIREYNVPTVSFFTSSAASSALDLSRGQIRTVAELPAEMARMLLPVRERAGLGPRKHHRGIAASDGSIAFLFNTCADLEGPFLAYIAEATGKPVFGVGPLLPSRDDVSGEDEVIGWLNLKPRGSVIYVAFGSLVSPSSEELVELAAGLEESGRPYVWVVREDAVVAERVGSRGMVVRGWAPQMRILRHESIGGYLCHCGWNSTVEAMVCGVPMLTWPIRGDQHVNAELVTALWKVGVAVREGGDAEVKRGDVASGIEKLMGDEGIRKRVADIKSVFDGGFPVCSGMAVDSFLDLVSKIRHDM